MRLYVSIVSKDIRGVKSGLENILHMLNRRLLQDRELQGHVQDGKGNSYSYEYEFGDSGELLPLGGVKRVNPYKEGLPQTCCGGVPVNDDGRCPICGDKL